MSVATGFWVGSGRGELTTRTIGSSMMAYKSIGVEEYDFRVFVTSGWRLTSQLDKEYDKPSKSAREKP